MNERGFSDGEPLVRRDLETLIAHARALVYYTRSPRASVWALATARYYGWTLHNRLPPRPARTAAEAIAHPYQARFQGQRKV